MNKERYSYEVNSNLMEFEFSSDGPNGNIKKIVGYNLLHINGIPFYNLGFGDLNIGTGEIDDLAVSNNKDTEKVLATVAATALEFINHFPDIPLYAKGSTPVRTRLYQMALTSNYDSICEVLDVYGYKDNKLSAFERGVNYEAFVAIRKI